MWYDSKERIRSSTSVVDFSSGKNSTNDQLKKNTLYVSCGFQANHMKILTSITRLSLPLYGSYSPFWMFEFFLGEFKKLVLFWLILICWKCCILTYLSEVLVKFYSLFGILQNPLNLLQFFRISKTFFGTIKVRSHETDFETHFWNSLRLYGIISEIFTISWKNFSLLKKYVLQFILERFARFSRSSLGVEHFPCENISGCYKTIRSVFLVNWYCSYHNSVSMFLISTLFSSVRFLEVIKFLWNPLSF